MREVKLWRSEGILVLVMMLTDASVMVYKQLEYFEALSSERFRFKLTQSHVLMKPKLEPSRSLDLYDTDLDFERIIVDPKIIIVLHPARPFTILVRQGNILLHNIGRQGLSLVSMVPFRQGFLTIDANKAELKGTKFAFDHRKLTRLSDGFLLKPLKRFVGKGIKKLCLFSPALPTEAKSIEDKQQYILVCTYKHIPPT